MIVSLVCALLAAVLSLPRPVQDDRRRETFDIVWRTVKEKHFDPQFGGVDWDWVREQYAPRAAAAASDRELHALLEEMLGELRQSHCHIIPPEAALDDEAAADSPGGVGAEVKFVGGRAVVARVEPESAAARAGLRPGFLITRIDRRPVAELVARLARSAEPPSRKQLRLARAVQSRLGGEPGSEVRLTYLDGRDREREAALTRGRLKGEFSPALGNFPPQYTDFESRRLADGLGYIRFNIFVPLVMEKVRAALRELGDAPGLVIDLRGNPGGLGGMSSGIAGLLCSQPGSLGTMRLRKGYTNFAIFPQPDPYPGAVAVLLDGASASTSEIFAGGLQELGRAVIVGERSMGAALPSIFQKLPTGALFQFAVADFKTPKGVLIEGRGVIPDVEVKLDRASLLGGRDPQLEAARAQIQAQLRGLKKGKKA